MVVEKRRETKNAKSRPIYKGVSTCCVYNIVWWHSKDTQVPLIVAHLSVHVFIKTNSCAWIIKNWIFLMEKLVKRYLDLLRINISLWSSTSSRGMNFSHLFKWFINTPFWMEEDYFVGQLKISPVHLLKTLWNVTSSKSIIWALFPVTFLKLTRMQRRVIKFVRRSL